MCESVFKVLIIGDPHVGKTSMVARYCYRDWIPNYKATVGADYAVKSIKWSTTETIRLHPLPPTLRPMLSNYLDKELRQTVKDMCVEEIWDLAGQDHYRAMTRTYYKGAAGCLIVCDITNQKSFEQAKAWKQDLDTKVFLPNCELLPCILIANKDDLPDRAVSDQEMNKCVRENGFLCWESMSVKLNRNVSETFCKLVERMLSQEHELSIVESPTLSAGRRDSAIALGTNITVSNSPCAQVSQDKGTSCCQS